MKRFEKPTEKEIIIVKTILHRYNFGVLSTISQNEHILGFPFGSVTPYVLDERGQVIIFISHLAEHTKNIKKNPKVSFTLIEDAASKDVQAKSRITYLGEATFPTEDEYDHLKRLYLKRQPQTKKNFDLSDFVFCRLELKIIRFIDTFARARWITIDDYVDE